MDGLTSTRSVSPVSPPIASCLMDKGAIIADVRPAEVMAGAGTLRVRAFFGPAPADTPPLRPQEERPHGHVALSRRPRR
jgi:hypothetical protein